MAACTLVLCEMKKLLYPHQESAFESLLETANAFFKSPWHHLPVKPRFSRLLVGPSGVGKTHMVRALASEVGAPFYSVDASNWMPLGSVAAQSGDETWQHICEFVAGNDRGIIFIDELDKLGCTHGINSAWLQFVRVEIFGLLDRRIPELKLRGHRFRDETKAAITTLGPRLRHNFMIIGGGAFEDAWLNWNKPSVGIRQSEEVRELKQRDLQLMIPPELTNRFAAPPVTIYPLKQSDYRHMLYRTASRLPKELAHNLVQIGRRELDSAAETALGVRWVEGILLKALFAPRVVPKEPAESLQLYAHAA